MSKLPKIFNDVIGPVMRGPSSSHTAATWRIGRVCLNILNEPLKKAVIEFDKDGIWASNFKAQGTTIGINGGLLGLDITDDRLKCTEDVSLEKDISIIYEINSFETNHPNTVRLILESTNGNKIMFVAVSTGGGSFEIRKIDKFDTNICGDYYEILIFIENYKFNIENIKSIVPDKIQTYQSLDSSGCLINLKSSTEFSQELLEQLINISDIKKVVTLDPLLPIVAGNESELPFTTVESMLNYSHENNYHLGQLGMIYEKCLSGLSESDLKHKMNNIIETIHNSIRIGLGGTKYDDRILQQQSHLIKESENKGEIIDNPLINNIIANITAIMESKSAMEVIVANPTAGSCGAVGGVLKAVADELASSCDELVNAYFAAGIIGAYFAAGPGFSAEEHGCQVECGAASGMAAAGIVQLFGGSGKQAINAASIAIQNMIGLVCDPVANRVEVPCLSKNINAGVNALSSAIMARSGFDAVIPYDQVLETVLRVSNQMPDCVKCTGKGGLAVTKAALDLEELN